MADVTVVRSGELMVAGTRADTDAGAEFVDAWTPTREGAKFTVVDSGYLVIEDADADSFAAKARAQGLTVDVTTSL